MPRVLVAVAESDGELKLHNAGKPAAMVAFADRYNHMAPDGYDELAWLTWRSLTGGEGGDDAFREWLEGLDELTASVDVLEQLRRKQLGELSACDRLEAMTAAELVELASSDSSEGHDLDKLIAEAALELEARKRLDDEHDAAAAASTTSSTEGEADDADPSEALATAGGSG